jgi:replication factor A1
MRGNWRIKVRIAKKSDVKTWTNAKGSGSLVNLEFIDKEGSRMQGTMFTESL